MRTKTVYCSNGWFIRLMCNMCIKFIRTQNIDTIHSHCLLLVNVTYLNACELNQEKRDEMNVQPDQNATDKNNHYGMKNDIVK